MVLQYIKQKDIDRSKWNACIETSSNGLIYANSWYLDVVCEDWDAIVADDYKAVLPLPRKRKFGLKYIYHPFFSQQLGLFFKDLSYNSVLAFIKHIPNSFIKYELSFNYMNNLFQTKKDTRKNYVLDINSEYTELYKNFSENTKRNIKKGDKNSFNITDIVSVEEFLELKRQNNINDINNKNFTILQQLFSLLTSNNHAKIIGAYDNNNALLGAALFCEFKNRITYLFSASSDVGKKKRVMFSIVNSIIKDNTEQSKIIDFEGSMIEGVARFFKGFGAVDEPYFRVYNSRIPTI